jgi:integrase
MTPLRQEMIQAMQIRNLSPYTQDNYLRAVTKLAGFYHRSPDLITQEDIKKYMLQRVFAHKSSWSTCNVIAAGLKFFYEKVLDRHHLVFNIATARKPVKLSQVLTLEEVSRLLKTIKNLKHKALVMTAYAGGLRLRELIALRVSDIESKRMAIRVQSGKGDRERYTLLSENLLPVLREYWRAEKPKEWLFPGKNADKHMSSRNVSAVA